MSAVNTTFGGVWLARALSRLPSPSGYCVALSGGGDSSALLLALAEIRIDLTVPVSALHVNHGLSAQAQQWADRCESLCTELGIPLTVEAVAVRQTAGAGPEAAARDARMGVFEAHLQPKQMLLTAHHLEDQAETVLLRVLRGSGVRGLAAMRRIRVLGSGWLARPLLDLPRQVLRSYLENSGQDWVEDPSNADRTLDRNYLRHEVFPLLRARWPAADRTLNRLADNAAESARIVADRAERDLAGCVSVDPRWLRVEPLSRLPLARRNELLRSWLGRLGLPHPGRGLLLKIHDQVIAADQDRTPRLAWPGVEVRRFRDLITAFPPAPPAAQPQTWQPSEHPTLEFGGGRLRLNGDPPQAWTWRVRTREGGESMKPAGSTCSRSLKNLFHEGAVPPWVRGRLPLLYEGDQLIAVSDQYLTEGLRERFARHGCDLAWIPRHPACAMPGQGLIEAPQRIG